LTHYPGTNSVDSQGPTPGIAGGSWLTLDTELAPFLKGSGKPMTSKDVINIRKLGYDYDGFAKQFSESSEPNFMKKSSPHVRVGGVSRADARGSFLMSVWTGNNEDGLRRLVGIEPVLSRWHVAGCSNCSTHLSVTTVIPMREISMTDAADTQFEVLIHTRERRFGRPSLAGKTPTIQVGQLH